MSSRTTVAGPTIIHHHNCAHCYFMIKGIHFNHPRSGVDIEVRGGINLESVV